MFSKTLEKIDLLENNKKEIINIWLNFEVVQYTLIGHNIKVDFFKKIFAHKILENCLKVIKSQSELGTCPVTNVMLTLFKSKDIPLADIYIIYVHLKNSFLLFLHKESVLDADILTEISMLIDYNLDGIIREYIETHYDNDKHTSISKTVITKNNHPKTILSPTQESVKLISAVNYLADIDMDSGMIDELEELEEDAISSIGKEEIITSDAIEESANLFDNYSRVLNMTYEFDELSYTLTILKKLLIKTDFETMDIDTSKMIQVYLMAIIDDLRKWRISIYVDSDAEDIHYLDKTLLSSIAQLEITLIPPEDFSDEDEIEFF